MAYVRISEAALRFLNHDPEYPLRAHGAHGGWVTSGHWAAKVAYYPVADLDWWPEDEIVGLARALPKWRVAERVSVQEVPSLYVPPRCSPCAECGATGVYRHEHDLEDDHTGWWYGECLACEGGVDRSVGKAVFEAADGARTAINARYCCLLQGEVYRLDCETALPPELRQLASFVDGEMVATVMPMRVDWDELKRELDHDR